MKVSRKRLLLTAGGITAVGAVATLVLGSTLGLFSATTPTQSNTFTAGTVTLAQSAVTSCTVSNIQPGDSGSCHFTVTYNGTVSDGVWLGADLSVTSPTAGTSVAPYSPGGVAPSPTAAAGLYDSTSSGLQFTITDDQTAPVTYMSGTSWNGATTTGTTPSVNDLLVNKTAITTAATAITFTISWSLPSGASNAYQAAASTLNMTVHAVQAGNNGTTSACTVGHTCGTITSWS